MSSRDTSALRNLVPGSHVCWIVHAPDEYQQFGRAVLAEAAVTNEKPVVFGPEGDARDALADSAVIVADPRTAFLAGRPLEPAVMFAMFEEQSNLARSEGYSGLRLVADMDWLLPLHPSTEDVVAFELLLDRHASRLGATIVCAYRTESFDTHALTGAACVHPIDVGDDSAQFKFIAGDHDSWSVLGEVDVAVAPHFTTAIMTAAAAGHCVIDASGLEFLDVSGMRLLAKAAQMRGTSLRLTGVRPVVLQGWKAARFGEVAPTVELVA